jgi:excisionase family DNA binding protein
MPGPPDSNVEWINAREVAAILRVSTTRVRELARRGKLPCVRHEGHYYFRRAQVEVIANAREARKVRITTPAPQLRPR